MKRFFAKRRKTPQNNEQDDLNASQEPINYSNDEGDSTISNTDSFLIDGQSDGQLFDENVHGDDDTIPINESHEESDPIIKEKTSLVHASSLPLESKPFSYTIREGDTLQNISDKFHIKESIIKKTNPNVIFNTKLNEGEVIQLFPDYGDSQKVHPIEVFVYDQKNKTDGLPGKLYIKKHNLIFSRKSLFHHHHRINLGGYLESSILPYPSQNLEQMNLTILLLNYLKDPSDKSTSVTECFVGQKDEMERLRYEIIKTADFHQEKVNYKPPDPNSISYSQEFAENAGIQTTKRRKSFIGKGKDKKKDDEDKIKSAPSCGVVQTMKIFLPQIQFLGGQLDVITKTDVFLVRKKLPPRYQNSNWTCLYKTSDDGFLLKTFFRKVANKWPLLMFIKTFDGDVIGAYIPSGLMNSSSFYGTIETFVFRFKTEIPKLDDLYITKLDDSKTDKKDEHANSEIDNEKNDQENKEINDKSDQQKSDKENQAESQINSKIKVEKENSNEENNDQINSEIKDEKESTNEENNDQVNSETKSEKESSNEENNDQINSEKKNEKESANTEKNEQVKTETNRVKLAQKPRTVLEVFKWNKLQSINNRNFVLSSNDSILFGGGNSSAIYIDKEMYNGYSDPCETFGSPRLTKKKKFDISVIEVWQVS